MDILQLPTGFTNSHIVMNILLRTCPGFLLLKARLCREEGGPLTKRLIRLRVAAEANRNMDMPQLQRRNGRLSRWRRAWTQKSKGGGRCSRYLPSYPSTEHAPWGRSCILRVKSCHFWCSGVQVWLKSSFAFFAHFYLTCIAW